MFWADIQDNSGHYRENRVRNNAFAIARATPLRPLNRKFQQNQSENLKKVEKIGLKISQKWSSRKPKKTRAKDVYKATQTQNCESITVLHSDSLTEYINSYID